MNTRTEAGHLGATVKTGAYRDESGKEGAPVRLFRIDGSQGWISERAYMVADLRWLIQSKHLAKGQNEQAIPL